MENAISTINLMPSTQSEVDRMYLMIKNEILSGSENPLKLEVQLKAMEDLIKKLRSDEEIKDQMIIEGYKHPEKSFEMYGAKFTKTTVSVKYDFSDCNDQEYLNLKHITDSYKKELKEREDFLKGLKKSMADPESGEIINPPVKIGKESISVKLL